MFLPYPFIVSSCFSRLNSIILLYGHHSFLYQVIYFNDVFLILMNRINSLLFSFYCWFPLSAVACCCSPPLLNHPNIAGSCCCIAIVSHFSSSIINLHQDVCLPPSTICTSTTVPVHLRAPALLLSRPPAVLSVHFFCDGCSLPPCCCGRRVEPHL